ISGGTWNMSGGTLNGGTLTLSNGAQFVVTSSGTWSGVTLNGNLSVPSGTNLIVSNGLTLNGTATIGSGSGLAALRFAGTQTLAGNGTVVLNSSDDGRNALAVINGSTTLTIGAGITVRGGYGTIGYQSNWGPSNVAVINQGTISADV